MRVVEGVVNPLKCSPEFGYSPTGHAFNDAYRYMDWLLTVPLLLIEIVLVMKLSPEETKKQSLRLGVLSGLMILNGYQARALVMHPPAGPTGLCQCSHSATSCTLSSTASRSPRFPARGCPRSGQVGMLGNRHLVVHLPHRLHHANDVWILHWQSWPHRWLHGRHPGRLHRV